MLANDRGRDALQRQPVPDGLDLDGVQLAVGEFDVHVAEVVVAGKGHPTRSRLGNGQDSAEGAQHGGLGRGAFLLRRIRQGETPRASKVWA